jgi:hypothetical protein
MHEVLVDFPFQAIPIRLFFIFILFILFFCGLWVVVCRNSRSVRPYWLEAKMVGFTGNNCMGQQQFSPHAFTTPTMVICLFSLDPRREGASVPK